MSIVIIMTIFIYLFIPLQLWPLTEKNLFPCTLDRHSWETFSCEYVCMNHNHYGFLCDIQSRCLSLSWGSFYPAYSDRILKVFHTF